MQPLAAGAKLAAYHARLQASHDYDIFADVLTLDEQVIGSASLLDGQVNIQAGDLIRRTASLTLSDPAGALDFSNGSAWSNTHIWVDRLVRIRHVVVVPGYGEVTAIPFIGPPSAISRNGAEVQVECQDKAALANRGSRPYTAAKGLNAIGAIRAIMANCTGEFRFRMPTTTRRLSKAYSVGWDDAVSPMAVATRIAAAELGMQLLYSCDGYLLLRELPAHPVVDVGYVTEQANAQADFTALVNYAIVTGGATSKKSGTATVTTRPVSSAVAAASSPVSPSTRLTRSGVPIYRPLLVSEDGYKKIAQTAARARAEVTKGSRVTDDLSANVIPMFHLDADDVTTVFADQNSSRTLRFGTGSIPLGVGGDMTIGFITWVSTTAAPRVSSHLARSVKRPKKPVKSSHHSKHHH